MRLLVISAAPLIPTVNNGWEAYSPYIKEMAVWATFASEIQFCCPVWLETKGLLVKEIDFEVVEPIVLEDFNLLTKKNILRALIAIFKNSFSIYKAMQKADHIHLRCPGNMGLLGCLVQIAFPSKPKTAKYAGNWDPKSKQPRSYKLQKWILGNTFLTKNMQVLVYGEWEGSTKNIKPFFTATYSEVEKEPMKLLDLKGKINFVFVGTLASGKNPLYAIQLVETLFKKGYDVSLNLYGEGIERMALEQYIISNGLENRIHLKGNKNQKDVTEAYQKSHFVLLPSKSEGWPKALAEGMFWGCVPIATAISCVPFMLDYGGRGVLLQMDLDEDVQRLEAVLNTESDYDTKRKEAFHWSRKYTLDVFESAIKKILNHETYHKNKDI